MGVAKPSDLIGKMDADFYPPEVAADYGKVDQGVFAGQPVINRERALRFPNGQELVFLNTKVPFKNDKGEVVGLIGVSRDITERKQAEAALEYERNLLRMLLGNSPDHIYFKDTQSRFIQASNSLADMFGAKSPDEMVGKTDFDFFDEAHARPAFEDEQEIIRTGWPVIAKEEREVWKDGRVTWASSTKLPMRDAAGKITGIMGVSRDITESKRSEEALREMQALYHSLVDHIPAAVFRKDGGGRYVFVNDMYCRLKGMTAEEILGKTPVELENIKPPRKPSILPKSRTGSGCW